MKKILGFLSVCLILLTGCGKENPQNQIQADKVYFFFSNGCPHCHDALDYINAKYPDLKITMVNVADPAGTDLFMKCAQKFKLGNPLGTPLFCMGDNYLMGWSPEYANQFDSYVKPFLN